MTKQRAASLEQLDEDIGKLRQLVADGQAPQSALDDLIETRQRLQQSSPADWDAMQFLITHLPDDGADDLLIVVKGHLILEYKVRQFGRSRMLNPSALDGARLSSWQMISLAEALCLPNEDPNWLWQRVKQLNSIRNKLAHNLDVDPVRKELDDFIAQIAARQPLNNPTLGGAISRLYGMVKGLCDLAEDPDFKVPR